MNRHRVLLALFLSAAAVIAWLATAEREAGSVHGVDVLDAVDLVAEDDERESLLSRAAQEPTGSRERAIASSGAEPASEETIVLSGTVVLVHDGKRNERPNGEFEIFWLDGDGAWGGGPVEVVEVVEGEWSVRWPGTRRSRASSFVLEGRQAFARRAADVEILPTVARQSFEVWSVGPIRLHVLDARTGASLPEAEAWIDRPRGGESSIDPGRAWIELNPDEEPRSDGSTHTVGPYEVTAGATPLHLEMNRPGSASGSVAAAFVRAPGYAWKFCEISFLGGGDRFVELSPGGDLVVQFLDPFRDVRSGMLVPSEARGASRQPRRDDRIEFESMVEGDYDLVFGDSVPTRRVTIVAGVVRTEVVAEEQYLDQEWASIEGRITVLPAWGPENPEDEELWTLAEVGYSGSVRHDDPLALEIDHAFGTVWPQLVPSSKQGVWTWSARVAAGTCRFRVDSTWYEEERVVHDGDRVDFELPSFVDVRVSCRSPEGALVAVETIAWTNDEFPVSTRCPGPTVDAPARLRVLPGRVSFWVSDDRLRITGQREFDVVANDQAIELRVRPVQGVDLTFRDGDMFVVFEVADAGVFAGSASVPIDYCLWQEDSLRLELAEAGPVTLSFSARPDGFEPIEDLVVDVPKGAFVEREVWLVRRH